MIGEVLPQGKGVDERAAKVAAQVRKKAAARGHQMRPSVVPAQALPQLAHLFNIVNSGTNTNQAQPGAQLNKQNEEARMESGSTSNGIETENESVAKCEDHPPVGLRTGLTALDSKKQKLKTKA
ncbi:hypothetical protein J5N97_003715 [Dioscorea zingiberensis]|uniref:Uncharacterized protein n=1 Tax=Dioscorea zingiberensis TaxID=325984 RepID=A0A9D5D6B9_9LILI|nr:hypothetical protein J5N97_003715 [Dioscorea zingiberensis]